MATEANREGRKLQGRWPSRTWEGPSLCSPQQHQGSMPHASPLPTPLPLLFLPPFPSVLLSSTMLCILIHRSAFPTETDVDSISAFVIA